MSGLGLYLLHVLAELFALGVLLVVSAILLAAWCSGRPERKLRRELQRADEWERFR